MPSTPQPILNLLNKLGSVSCGVLNKFMHYSGLVIYCPIYIIKPSNWSQPIRAIIMRQILFSGVSSIKYILYLAVIIAAIASLQTFAIISKGGGLSVSMMVNSIIVRELIPLMVNFIFLFRSGSAIVAEVASINVNQEIRVLSGSGLDAYPYLVLPRIIGAAFSSLILTMIFICVLITFMYILDSLLHGLHMSLLHYYTMVFEKINILMFSIMILKAIIPSIFSAAICASCGMSKGLHSSEIPLVVQTALTHSFIFMCVNFLSLTAISVFIS